MRLLRAVVHVGGLVTMIAWMASSDIAASASMSCGSVATIMVSEKGGRLLSVSNRQGRCVIVFLLQQNGERPRRWTVDVPLKPGGVAVDKIEQKTPAHIVPVNE